MLGFGSKVRGIGLALGALLIGCGGKVVYVLEGGGGEGGGTGGDGGAASSSSSVSTVATSTSEASTTVSVGVGGGGPGLVDETPVDQGGFFTVDVLPGTLGVTLTATPQVPFAETSMTRLTAPSGAVVVDGLLPSNQYAWTWYGSVAAATPQIAHPETFPLAQGTWRFDVSASTSTGAVDARVWRRSTVDGAFHGGVIDLNVFIADDIVDEAYVLEVAANAYSDWGGIELGDVRFFDVGPEFVNVDENNVFDLVAQTSGVPTRPALNVMAVGTIGGAFEGAAGFSLGIPGNPMDPGNTQSAVVWMVLYDDFFDPIILRHEAGHFGGLFHTSEFSPGLKDSLEDTPFCDDVNAQLDACPDYDFIMFPSGGSGLGLFSEQQSTVLRAGALYRGVYAPGESPMVPYGPPLDAGASSLTPRVATGADLATAAHLAHAANSPRARARDEGWRAALDPAVAAQLAGIGCPPGGTAASAFYDELEGLGASDADAMLAVGLDATAPGYVRRRALGMTARLASRAGRADSVVGAIEGVATDASAPDLARSGALEALARLDLARARALGASLTAPPKRLAAIAKTLR